MQPELNSQMATDPSTVEDLEGIAWSDSRARAKAQRAAQARQSSGRRRFVDPTTCERDYSQAEIEFMQAMQSYKLRSGRMFPTWSEVLEVLKELGYEKADHLEEAGQATPSTASRLA